MKARCGFHDAKSTVSASSRQLCTDTQHTKFSIDKTTIPADDRVGWHRRSGGKEFASSFASPLVMLRASTVNERLVADRLGSGWLLAALSGGVDSAVAAALAVKARQDAVGVTMRLWNPGDGELNEKVRQCCGPTAYEDAQRAAGIIGIPHYIVNFEAAFERAVIRYFCDEYVAGRTPNPCVACNNLIKFGALLDFAHALGARQLVTGHYARIRQGSDGPHLLRAVDRTKDQSYMLAGLRPVQIASMILPLGEYSKDETRRIAFELALGVADKPDSMDLCFVNSDYRSFILRRFPESAARGPIITSDGRVIGQHDGLLGFTVGQRKGLPGGANNDGSWYVMRTDRRTNALILGRREELARRTALCSNANLIRSEHFAGGRTVHGLAMSRYRSKLAPATVTWDGAERLNVGFEEPVAVLTPGQLLVLYDRTGEEVLASGIIE